MLSIETITLGLVIIVNAMISWVLASQGWKVAMNRYFILAVAAIIFWALGTLIFFVGAIESVANFGLQLFYIAPMFSIAFLTLFATFFPRKNNPVFIFISSAFMVLTIGYALSIAIEPHLLTQSIILRSQYGLNNEVKVNTGAYTIYTAYFNLGFTLAFLTFYSQIRRHSGQLKNQLISIFIGTFLAAIFSLITNLLLPVLGDSRWIWLGPTWTLFYIVTVSISIIKHQLFDIKLAAMRSVAYIGVLVTLSATYYLLAYLLSVTILGGQISGEVSLSPLNILLALSLAFLFQPIKKFFDKLSNNIFYRDNYNADEFYSRFSNLLATTSDLRGILERASNEIASTFKAEQAFFFLYHNNSDHHHLSAGTHHHARLLIGEVKALDEYVKLDKKVMVISESLPQDSSLRRILLVHKISLIMPLWHDEQVIGYVSLGDKRSGTYNISDIRVLSTTANELVIAIQNALSVEEIRELNATLQQRIDVATKELRSSNAQLRHLDEVKDEFMSMASHQLRTPLTSIKGYMSMVLEGDMGKITPQQEQVLTEAFNSSERMVRLIADFLNVSRLQTGKFVIDKSPSDIVDVVRTEVDSLQVMSGNHNMKLAYKPPKEPIIINMDEAKVRQVIMNFIDNAIYYSRANTTINVSLVQVNNNVEFRVIDTGIGVPVEEQPMLFSKFFRAKNARKQRPDGTGVGLYLAKKVIVAHDGQMIFNSVEGQGSTFGFTLPIKSKD